MIAFIACLAGAVAGILIATIARSARRRPVALAALAMILGVLAYVLYYMSLHIPYFVPIAFGFLCAYLLEDAKAFRRIR